MQLLSLIPLFLAAASVQASPIAERDDISVISDVLLFDAAAFPDPANPSNTLVNLQAFVSLRRPTTGVFAAGVEVAIKAFGVDVGDRGDTLKERVKLFSALGRSGKVVKVNIGGCSKPVQLPGTSGLPNLGIALGNVNAGQCSKAKQAVATVQVSGLDSRKFSATVFNSPNSGFGVISDVDDTLRIANVLDRAALIRSTLLEDPRPVAGMPALYSSLVKSLNDPQFIYVTGAPFQLYPFIKNFLDTTYPSSKGPLLLQNLNILDIPAALDFASNVGLQEYKVSMIDRIHGMYPKKKFLAVGDSTQKDPETYAVAFKKYGDFITCIWIRRVDGADNSDARFAAAFTGVPAGKLRIFTDAEIPSLQNIDVAGGKC